MDVLDCRGLACPQPVMRCRDCVDGGGKRLSVLVDNAPAVENVQRFLQGRGFAVSVVQEGDHWKLTAAAADSAPATAPGPAACPEGGDALRTVVLVTTETLGRGDDALGAKLMANFLATLGELGPRLWRVILLNGGVRLASAPGPALDALCTLADAGVGILVCGTCLSHYDLLEQKRVGDTSNMLDIVTSLDLADKIIRP